MSASRWLPRPAALAITFMITITLLVPAAYLAAPRVHRWRMLNDLTAADPADRERALNYVITAAPNDERVLRGAIDALGRADRENFLQIAAALERGDLWTRRHIPDGAWLRWLGVLAETGDGDTRIFAAQRLGELGHLAGDDRIASFTGALVSDGEPDVRYNALVSIAALGSAAGEPAAYVDLIRRLAADPEPRVARHAWIFLGLLGADPLPAVQWSDVEPSTVEAMLWAHAQAAPSDPGPLLAALTDAEADPLVRAAAVYALHFSDDQRAQAALLAAASAPMAAINERNQLITWRAILALPRPDLRKQTPGPLEEAIMAPAWDEGDNPLVEPIALASIYRLGIAGARRQTEDYWGYDAMMKLATVEGQEPPYLMEWPLTGDKPPLLRVLTVAVSANPHIGDLRPAFTSPIATIRDLACVIAAEKFDDDTLAGMIESLLGDYNDEAKMSAAILSGLTGMGTDRLRERIAEEDLWAAQQIERLGLWMQGELAELDGRVADLLLRDDLPRTTVLLAMLHRGERDAALDWLLNPRGEPPLDLVELFDQHRWWHVLKRYLPREATTQIAPFWVWGDPRLEAFQVDVLRNWYLVNRDRLRDP